MSEHKDLLYVARTPKGREFDWVNDIVTIFNEKNVEYLLNLLNKNEGDGNWDHEKEDCLAILKNMKEYFEEPK